MTECSFISNTATYAGGGFFCNHSSSPAIEGCVCDGNPTALGSGGGLACLNGSSASVYGCSLFGNGGGQAGGGALVGGALYCEELADIVLTGCTFSDNGADVGGANVECFTGAASLNNCILAFGTSGPAVN